jgi:glycosyltransferase involved in cell wall biosynthesis
VAGNFPRKRLDILFRGFAQLSRGRPELYLVQHGARLNDEQRALLNELGISQRVLQTPPLSREELAALYRAARLVLLTSDREGFGFPALEGLAAGAVVVLSDIPAFREAAGESGIFCTPGQVDGWAEVAGSVLNGQAKVPPAALRAERARAFSWAAHARTVAGAYERLGASL